MKVAFIQPPLQDFYSTPIRRQPLGLLYLAAVARQKGCEVELINGHTPKKKVISLPEEFSYLKEFMDGPDPRSRFPFKHYYHFGMSFEMLRARIKASGADVFAISSLFTPYYQEVDMVIRMVREECSGAHIVVGGGHATIHPEHYREQGVDCVILGEGEVQFASFLDNMLSGRTYVPSQELSVVEDLDTVPFPARDLLLERDLKHFRKKGTSLMFSRGCPHGCSFCVTHRQFGRRYRHRSIDNLLAEIDQCVTSYGITHFNFEDDNLFCKPDVGQELLEALMRYQEQHGVELDLTAMNGVSLESLSPSFVLLMRRAGFREFNVSLVVVQNEQQRALGRPFGTEHAAAVVREARTCGMNVRGYFILGLPGQTQDDVRETVRTMTATGVQVVPSVYYDVLRPLAEWKVQRSSAFANASEALPRRERIRLFNELTVLRRPVPVLHSVHG